MLVTAKTFGPDAARKVYDFQMDRYLSRRATQARDVLLLDAHDQPWIHNGKGAVALYTLRDMIGEERVNVALRTFLAKHRAGVPPHPTSYDLFAELRAATPDTQYVLTDLFQTVTLWDVSAKSATVARNSTGQYVVTLIVTAKKLRADAIGNETEVPMTDIIETGVFETDRAEPLYMERHRIRGGQQTIRVTVPRQPSRAGIDPRNRLIDRNRANNVDEVSL